MNWIIGILTGNFDPRKAFCFFVDGDGNGGGDAPAGGDAQAGGNTPVVSWKQNLNPDLRNSPLVQKFSDDINGLNESVKSYANLEKLLGHEKVPIPKDDKDTEGWARFSKAMGIPDSADAYGLSDPEVPEELGEMSFDKKQFSEIAHGLKLTPNQAKGLWQSMVNDSIEARKQEVAEFKKNMANTVNQLRSKWGDAYESHIKLGQMVINKFSGGDKKIEDFLTTSLAKDARGVEFLAKIGNHFAENKIGEFNVTRFSRSPDQAKSEYEKIMSDPKHPYNDINSPEPVHKEAVDYVNQLLKIMNQKPFG